MMGKSALKIQKRETKLASNHTTTWKGIQTMRDLIRREDAIRAIDSLGEDYISYYKLLMLIGRLPTAEPEQRKGKWIEYPDCLRYEGAYSDDHIVCSDCGHVFSILDNCTEEFDFCPNCGAEMSEGE
jgi:hypothetical protein